MSRLGDSVESISISNNHYGVTLGDNSIRIIRTDNNKVMISQNAANFTSNTMACDPASSSNALVVPYGDSLQFIDFSTEYLNAKNLLLRPRNAVSTAQGIVSHTKAIVKAFSLSADQQTLCTLDELYDRKTRIRVVTLKFWSRSSDDFSDFTLD